MSAAYAFPRELVEAIRALWAEHGDAPPLPAGALLRLVEVAFLASLATEEGRPVAFTLCVLPARASVLSASWGGEVEAWDFAEPQPLDVPTLRRLAVAADASSAAIRVQRAGAGDGLLVHGLLNMGISWTIARLGFTERAELLPAAFLLRVDGPGALTVFHHQAPALVLAEGRIRRPEPVLQVLGGLPPVFEEGIQALLSRQRLGVDAPASARGPLARAYAQALLTVVDGIRARGHGGALILAGAQSAALDSARALVRPRYPAAPRVDALASRVLALAQARQDVEAEHAPDDGVGYRPPPSPDRDLQLRTAGVRLLGAATFVANLSGTDGAILLRADLTLVGFGAEIAVEPRLPAPAFEVSGRGREARPLSLHQLGMRHRSALWLCASAPDVVAFVVSQDGAVSLVYGAAEGAYLLPNLEALNANLR